MDSSVTVGESPPPGRRRFYGWRLALVGAFVLTVAGDGLGMPKIASALLGDPLSDGAGGGGFVVGLVLLRSVFPALLLAICGVGG